MKDLKLANPKKIDVAVPGNLACGYVVDVASAVVPKSGVAARLRLPNVEVYDCRTAAESAKTPGVKGAVSVEIASNDTASSAVDKAIAEGKFSSKYAPIVLYSTTGQTSGIACERLQALGYFCIANAGTVEDAVAAAEEAK
jgi:rhodanese-related sulfurtransferase